MMTDIMSCSAVIDFERFFREMEAAVQTAGVINKSSASFQTHHH